MPTSERAWEPDQDASLRESRLAYHLRCLAEDATDPEVSSVERLALVRERVRRIREIRQELDQARGCPAVLDSRVDLA